MQKQMFAAVFEGEGKLKIKKVPVPVVENEKDVIIKVDSVSICGTDVHIVEVPPGFIAKPGTILGHEISGSIVDFGKGVKSLNIGDRVVINPNEFDCTCDYCKLNQFNHCKDLKALGIGVDGGFAQFCKVSEIVCHKISASIPPDVAAFAEPLACVINAADKVKLQPGESVVIFGAGPIGLLFMKMFKLGGASKIIVSDLSEYRRKFALKLGADIVIDPDKENIQTIIKNAAPGGVDIAVDAVGSQIKNGIDCVKKGGRILLFGFNSKAEPKVKQSEITCKEVKILGTWLANATFPKAVKLIESDVLNLEELITETMSLNDIHKGIELLSKGQAIKIMINP